MQVKEKLNQALNRQINRELYSAYLYLSMSSWFEAVNLKGFSQWMRVQAKEEVGHAMKIYDFVVKRGGRVILSQIESPPSSWNSPLSAFEDVYEHEKKVTQMIHELLSLARAENDPATEVFLHWFVEEQVEEEDSASFIVAQLKAAKDAPGALFMLDKKLAERKSS
ncbi:ferritin [Candidatus Aerophobetes bacterium]|nr:ferritin [Candidatus Aerophobetes bacterium]